MAFWELFLISGLVFLINPQKELNAPQFYFYSTLLSRFIIFINVCVLTNFSVFDINEKIFMKRYWQLQIIGLLFWMKMEKLNM